MTNREYAVLDWLESQEDSEVTTIGYVIYSNLEMPHYDAFIALKYLGWDEVEDFRDFASDREALHRTLRKGVEREFAG